MKILITVVVLLAPFMQARAAERVMVQPAQVEGPDGADRGKVAIVGNQMIFIDDVNPANSFAVSRSEIAGLDMHNGVMTLNLSQPFASPLTAGPRLVVQFSEPNGAAAISSWAGVPLSAGRTPFAGEANRVQAGAPGSPYEFNVRHDDDNGRLVIGTYDVHFESFRKPEHSKTWAFKDIKEFRRDGDDNEVKIVPYHGDAYKFKIMGGRPMTDDVYNLIGDRIVAARQR